MLTHIPISCNAWFDLQLSAAGRALLALACAYPSLQRYHVAVTKPLSRTRIVVAWLIALAADALQIGLFPLFVGGALEGADAALDAIVALMLVMLCGFHPAFLPTIVAEALPLVDLVPSWTLAVMFVTRGRTQPQLPASKIN